MYSNLFFFLPDLFPPFISSFTIFFLGLITTALSTSLYGETHCLRVVLLAGPNYSGYDGLDPFTLRKDHYGMSQLDGVPKRKSKSYLNANLFYHKRKIPGL